MNLSFEVFNIRLNFANISAAAYHRLGCDLNGTSTVRLRFSSFPILHPCTQHIRKHKKETFHLFLVHFESCSSNMLICKGARREARRRTDINVTSNIKISFFQFTNEKINNTQKRKRRRLTMEGFNEKLKAYRWLRHMAFDSFFCVPFSIQRLVQRVNLNANCAFVQTHRKVTTADSIQSFQQSIAFSGASAGWGVARASSSSDNSITKLPDFDSLGDNNYGPKIEVSLNALACN